MKQHIEKHSKNIADDLNISLLQFDIAWEKPQENLQKLAQYIENANSDLIVLPEMFTTGFSMTPKPIATTMDGEVVQELKKMTKKYQMALCGSLVISEENEFVNRFLFIFPNGKIQTYDKKHLFTLAGENKAYEAGRKRIIVEYKGWRICPLICYDLRFPVWSRNTQDFDILMYVANWPTPRKMAWDSLLKARAIENMCFTVGVNRIGVDFNGHSYSGNSAVYDVLGNQKIILDKDFEGLKTIQLSKSHIKKYREKLGFLNDRDSFHLS